MGNIRDGAGERRALVSGAFGVVVQGAGDSDGLIGEIAKVSLLAIQQCGRRARRGRLFADTR